ARQAGGVIPLRPRHRRTRLRSRQRSGARHQRRPLPRPRGYRRTAPRVMSDAEIIAVGSELLTPNRIDTNSLWLTDQLNSLGVEVRRKVVVGDDRELLSAVMRQSLKQVDIVILSGGLGPTEDDITREAVAEALGRPLVFRQDLLDALTERFQRLNRKMADNNRRQTFVVEGAEPLPNGRGTAAGQWIEDGSK